MRKLPGYLVPPGSNHPDQTTGCSPPKGPGHTVPAPLQVVFGCLQSLQGTATCAARCWTSRHLYTPWPHMAQKTNATSLGQDVICIQEWLASESVKYCIKSYLSLHLISSYLIGLNRICHSSGVLNVGNWRCTQSQMFLPFHLFVRDQRDQRSQSNLIALTWKVWKIFGAVYLHGWHLQVTSYMKAKQAICPGS